MKSIIFDLDDTLYDYHTPHSLALKNVIDHFRQEFKIESDEAMAAFKKARKMTHSDLNGQAASHNRLLYFQKMLETVCRNPLDHALDLYNIYWDSFLDKMVLFDGVMSLLEHEKSKGTKMCILTDLTAHIQFRKLKRLGLNHYLDILITSEEVGHDKPHPLMFKRALEKLKSNKVETIMIGDNWEKDIQGAKEFGLKSIWFNHKNVEKPILKDTLEVQLLSEIPKILNRWN